MEKTNEALCDRCSQPVDVIREADFVRLVCKNPACRFIEDVDSDFDDDDAWYEDQDEYLE
jgi:hypothetical protein